MKILLINNLGRRHSGAETMVWQIKSGLTHSGHTVKLLSGDEPARGALMSDYEFHSFPDDAPSRTWLFLANFSAIGALRRILREFKPDVVHLHNTSKASPLILALLGHVPTVLTIHDHLSFDPTTLADLPTLKPHQAALSGYFTSGISGRYFWEKLRFGLYRRFAKNIDLTLTCSNFYHQAALESGLYRHVETLHNGILLPKNATSVPAITGRINLLFAGRLDEGKGTDILIRAYARAHAINPELRLTICGSGDQERALKDLARGLNVEQVIEFKSFVEPIHLAKLYDQTHIVVVPSLYPDNFPTVCLEAMGRGRAVIGTDIGGIPEMVLPGRTGLLVEPGNPAALAEAITTLSCDPQTIRSYGRAGRTMAEAQFSQQRYLDATLDAYHRAAGYHLEQTRRTK